MNMKVCKKIQPGAIVRESWDTCGSRTAGIVLHKEHVEEEHIAKVLGGVKTERYDLYIHWFKRNQYRRSRPNPEKVQCWEVMLVSHAGQ